MKEASGVVLTGGLNARDEVKFNRCILRQLEHADGGATVGTCGSEHLEQDLGRTVRDFTLLGECLCGLDIHSDAGNGFHMLERTELSLQERQRPHGADLCGQLCLRQRDLGACCPDNHDGVVNAGNLAADIDVLAIANQRNVVAPYPDLAVKVIAESGSLLCESSVA